MSTGKGEQPGGLSRRLASEQVSDRCDSGRPVARNWASPVGFKLILFLVLHSIFKSLNKCHMHQCKHANARTEQRRLNLGVFKLTAILAVRAINDGRAAQTLRISCYGADLVIGKSIVFGPKPGCSTLTTFLNPK